MDKEKYVECGTHGKQQATFVCQHIIQTLHDGKARGFWWADDLETPGQMHGVLSAKPKYKKQMANGIMKVKHLPGLSSYVVPVMTEPKKLILAQINNGGSFGSSAF